MINFVFDNKNEHGYIPNLVKDLTLKPGTKEWWDLCLQSPHSYEYNVIKYLKFDSVPFNQMLASELPDDKIGHYPVNLNFFDPEIDYFSLMDPISYDMLKARRIKFVFHYSEGDWLDLEIIPHLIDMCDKHNVDLDDTRFVTANGLAFDYGHPFVYFPDDEVYYRYLHIRKQDYIKQINVQPRSKKFTCLNGIDKDFRRLFAASLWQHGLHDFGYFSYTNKKYTTSSVEDDSRSPLKWKEFWSDVDICMAQFELNTPFTCDELSAADHNNHSIIDKRYFEDAYWNFVTETHFDTHTIFLTEKTFKPILNLQPFVIIGNPGSLDLLQELGYQTFDDYLDESYDTVGDAEERMHRCFTECYKLVNYTHESHVNVTKDLIDILHHNQKHFLSSKADRLNTMLEHIR